MWLIYHKDNLQKWKEKSPTDIYTMLLDTYLDCSGEKEGMGLHAGVFRSAFLVFPTRGRLFDRRLSFPSILPSDKDSMSLSF